MYEGHTSSMANANVVVMLCLHSLHLRRELHNLPVGNLDSNRTCELLQVFLFCLFVGVQKTLDTLDACLGRQKQHASLQSLILSGCLCICSLWSEHNQQHCCVKVGLNE